ncbi:DUF1285 domain-containing protein [Chelatococcus daeguensis]|uniref:DUF1285 domain-containing protein n=1 Tax=Chelatococcus daeguensis TaxID=444444 RepID=UPI0007AC037B|nr:DUF1285 domain-containing protein [Chelatococcus daeguensis]KZE27447.1 hypothetical protein AVW15_09985 [Chelatococcus daeguensis]MBM3085664.1 DUF1285 domain-containing protein [Chelatococcus daeguensis]
MSGEQGKKRETAGVGTHATPESLPSGLAALFASAGPAAKARPVEKWNPPHCGMIDMRITADGSWHYRGSPIGRPALVKLFASILRRDPEGYVLVTPVERVGITVEDVPFIAVEMAASEAAGGRVLTFRTNVDDIVQAGPNHPLRFETDAKGGMKPYVHIRGGLWARLTRALALDLADLVEVRPDAAGGQIMGVASAGAFFAIAAAGDGEDGGT